MHHARFNLFGAEVPRRTWGLENRRMGLTREDGLCSFRCQDVSSLTMHSHPATGLASH